MTECESVPFLLTLASNMSGTYAWQDFYVFFMLLYMSIALLYPVMYGVKNISIAMMLIFVLLITGTYFTLDVLVKALGMTNEIVFNHIDIGCTLYAERIFSFVPLLVITVFTGAFLLLSISLSTALYNRKFCSVYLSKRRAERLFLQFKNWAFANRE